MCEIGNRSAALPAREFIYFILFFVAQTQIVPYCTGWSWHWKHPPKPSSSNHPIDLPTKPKLTDWPTGWDLLIHIDWWANDRTSTTVPKKKSELPHQVKLPRPSGSGWQVQGLCSVYESLLDSLVGFKLPKLNLVEFNQPPMPGDSTLCAVVG